MNPESAIQILEEGTAVLESVGVTWWLSAGTALGAYRDGLSDRFLRKDTDIDVGVLGDDEYQRIKTALESAGFISFRTYQVKGFWAQLAMIKNGTIFDIYFFNPDKDIILNLSDEGVMAKPLCMVRGMNTLDIRGRSYPAPSPIEKYLTLRYGDWKTEKGKSGTWANDAANLRSWASLSESSTSSTGGTKAS